MSTDGVKALPQPAAWLDCFGEPHRRREDAMATEESIPEPLYTASALGVLGTPNDQRKEARDGQGN